MPRFEEQTHPEIASALEERLDDKFDCKAAEKVEYTLEYDGNKEVNSRSFETDVCIMKDGVPQVILEVKRGAASTHNLRAYAAKSEVHKQVYPFLQYGMLVLDADRPMTKKYIWHGEDFDFFYFSERDMDSADDLDPDEMDELADIINNNIQKGEKLKAISNGRKKPKSFDRELHIK